MILSMVSVDREYSQSVVTVEEISVACWGCDVMKRETVVQQTNTKEKFSHAAIQEIRLTGKKK